MLDTKVDKSVHRSAEEAQADLDQVLKGKDADPELVTHWAGLGGRVPKVRT